MRNSRPGFRPVLVLLLGLWIAPAASAAAAPLPVEVDLELVLAVDVSYSMDREEQRIQRDGYVDAFRHPEVIAAIQNGKKRRIAVTYFEWSGPAAQEIIVDWTIIDGPDSASAFADYLGSRPLDRRSSTSISAAFDFAVKLFEQSGVTGSRRVIDISGDGPNNAGAPVVPARDATLARGIVINGLPILMRGRDPNDVLSIPDLDAYYRDCVIGGSGAFMVAVEDVAGFASAIRRKLVLEISDLGSARLPVLKAAVSAPADCLAGEKRRSWTQ